MNTGWTEDRRRSPINEILASRNARPPEEASRYGEGARLQREREEVRESYLAIDVRLRSGESRGLLYYDLAGSIQLDKDRTVLTVPFRTAKLIIQGYRLNELYRAILHHSLDVLAETHRPEFAEDDSKPVITSIEIVEQEG